MIAYTAKTEIPKKKKKNPSPSLKRHNKTSLYGCRCSQSLQFCLNSMIQT